jgi:hypothetical protein
MIEKERENKHLAWLGIEMSTSIPWDGADFQPIRKINDTLGVNFDPKSFI